MPDLKHGQDTLGLALAALRAGCLDQAETHCQALLQRAPHDAGAHLLAATLALHHARFGDAQRWARSCLALRPGHVPALLIAGHAARATGDLSAAAECFREAATLSPERPEAFFQLCVVQLESQDPAAQSTLDDLLQRFPEDGDGWRQIGTVLHRANQLEAAAVAFTRAAKANPDPAIQFHLGVCLLALGRPEEAKPALRHAVEHGPDLVEALLPFAQALRQTGKPAEARRHLERRIAAKPAKAQVYFTLGLVCDDLHDIPGAVTAYRQCLALQPDIAEAHVNLGLALQSSGETDLAKQSYREALRLRPDTFGRIAQALSSTRKGQLWLNVRQLRRSLGG